MNNKNRDAFVIVTAILLVLLLVALSLHSKTDKEKRWLELGTKMDMQTVNFYGRVVDQYGDPVVGAVVPYELAGSALGGSNGAGVRKTDNRGEFRIEGREGSKLLLKTITHPEIEFGYSIPENSGTTWREPNMSSMAIHGFQPSRGASEVLWTDTSPQKPYLFLAWRVGGEKGLVTGNVSQHSYAKHYDFDKVYTLNFLKPKMEISKEGEHEGQLRVIFQREADASDKTVRWEARLIPVDGGIQVTKDPYMNLAPEGGYQPEIHIVRTPADIPNGWGIDSLANQQYYFYANHGKIYGSLFVNFDAFVHEYNQFSLRINYKINRDGERILATVKEEE